MPENAPGVERSNPLRVWVVVNRRTATVHAVTCDTEESLTHLRNVLSMYDNDPQAASRTVALVYPLDSGDTEGAT